MIYSDTTTGQGLVQFMRNITKSDENTLPETLARQYLNNALDKYSNLAIFAAGQWQFDDVEHDDYPIATTDMTAGQQDYEFNRSMLTVRRVEVNDGSNWFVLKQVDETDFSRSLSELATRQGLPTQYYIKGSSIFLVPNPVSTVSDGIKVYYERALKKFDGTTTQIPGVPSIHHEWLGLYAALLFAVQENLANKSDIKMLLDEKTDDIGEYYNRRNKERRPKMRVLRTPSY